MSAKALALVLALLALAAQAPVPNYHDTLKPNDPEYNTNPNETRVPPGTVCKRPEVTIRANERAVHCECTYSCEIDPDGNVTEKESDTCMTWCHLNNRHCSCWPEGDPQHPCVKRDGGNALVDMDGHILAVARWR